MSRLASALALVLLVLLVCPGVWAATPTDALQQIFAEADRILTDPDTEERPLERLLAVRKLVNKAFDFRSAAELASGEHWRARTAAEQDEFTWLFADLLERSFVARIAAQANLAGGTRIKYLGESVEGGTARVQTAMGRKDGGELLLAYRLTERDGAWKIRDVAIDGVSVTANYRAQLDRVLSTASFPELLTQMRAMVGTVEPPAETASRTDASPAAAPAVEVSLDVTPETPADVPSPAPVVAAADVPPPIVSAVDVELQAETALAEEVSLPMTMVPVADVSSPAPTACAVDVSPPAPMVSVDVALQPETAPREEASLPVQTVSIADLPLPAPELRVAAVEPMLTAPAAEPPPIRVATEERTVPPAVEPPPLTRTTKAYWLQMIAGTADDTGRLVSRLRDGKLFVGLERANAAGKPVVHIRVGPFQEAEEAVIKLLDLQTKGHDPFLIAERE